MDRLEQPLSSSSSATPRASGATTRNSPYNRSSRSFGADSAGAWKHDRYQDQAGGARGAPRHRSSRAPMFFPQDKSEVNQVKPTGKLTIENLHWDVSEQDLKALFEQIGPVTKAYIKYDRSDRSTGVAVVVYDDPNHALQAKNEYDGAKAKGQVISITQEMRADRPRRVQDQPRSLLSRFDLSSRLKGNGVEARQADGGARFADRLGPVRNGGRGGQSETKRAERAHTAPAKREKRKPVTAADLDAELEAFMSAPSDSAPPSHATAAAPATGQPDPVKASSNADDVEMA